MKIAIIGAGAIGGYVGVKLALAGEEVTLIVRGANLDAIRKNGIKLVMTTTESLPARRRSTIRRKTLSFTPGTFARTRTPTAQRS